MNWKCTRTKTTIRLLTVFGPRLWINQKESSPMPTHIMRCLPSQNDFLAFLDAAYVQYLFWMFSLTPYNFYVLEVKRPLKSRSGKVFYFLKNKILAILMLFPRLESPRARTGDHTNTDGRTAGIAAPRSAWRQTERQTSTACQSLRTWSNRNPCNKTKRLFAKVCKS